MKLLKSTIAALAMASSSLFALSGHAEEGHRNCRANPGGEWPIDPAAYVVRNCAFCHGPSLQGLAVAPRLAGQHQEYIVNQLERFRDKERNSPFSLKYMSHVAVSVLPENYCEVAAYIATMPAEARSDGNEALTAKGEEIFQTWRTRRQYSGLPVLPWPGGSRRWTISTLGRPVLLLLEKKTGAVGRRIR